MARDVRYAVKPGMVPSANDRDWHYVGPIDLMRLYGVHPAECVIFYGDERDLGKSQGGLIELRPRRDGNYRV
jgi:hypothetical protein